MARRRGITWRSRVLIRTKSPFLDDFSVSSNKRKRDMEQKHPKPGSQHEKDPTGDVEMTFEEQVRKRHRDARQRSKELKRGKKDPLGEDKFKASKGDLLAISLAPLGAVALAAAFVGGGELAAGLKALDELAEIAGTTEIELPNMKMD